MRKSNCKRLLQKPDCGNPGYHALHIFESCFETYNLVINEIAKL